MRRKVYPSVCIAEVGQVRDSGTPEHRARIGAVPDCHIGEPLRNHRVLGPAIDRDDLDVIHCEVHGFEVSGQNDERSIARASSQTLPF